MSRPAGGRFGHIPALDGIRGLAVIGVVAHHLGHLRGGYLGVDAFFVLSGFLITGLLVDEIEGERTRSAPVDLAGFWVRRAKRLFPALLLFLAVVVGVETWVLDDGVAGSTLRTETLTSLGYVFNWWAIVDDVDYWSSFAAPSPLRHMWSLAIEEQFYVVWPLVVAALAVATHRRWWRWSARVSIGAVAAILAVASGVWAVALYTPDDALRVYYGTDTRMAAMLMGAVGATWVRRPATVESDRAGRAGHIGLLLVVPVAVAWFVLDGTDETVYRGGLLAVGVATTIVVVAATLAPESLLARLLSVQPLRWCGSISYGLYLWHWPLIVWLTPARTGLDGVDLLAVRLLASLAVTLVSYRLIEQPIRRSQPSGWRTLGCSIPAIAAVGALAIVATATSSTPTPQLAAGTRSTAPIPGATPTDAAATKAAATDGDTATNEHIADPDRGAVSDPADDGTNRRRSAVGAATIDDAPSIAVDAAPAAAATAEPLRLMVVGDSGAYFLGELLAEVATDHLVLPRGEIGCGIVNIGGGAFTDEGAALPDPDGCDDWPSRWTSDAAIFEPDVTLLVLSWPGVGNRDLSEIGGSTAAHPCDTDFDEHYTTRMTAAIDAAGSSGGRVVVATTPYYSGPGADGTFVARVDCLNSVMTTTAQLLDADVLDLAAWTCPGGRCRIDAGGEVLRPDGLHFDGPGGRLAADWVLGELTRRD